jgi:hypothetical protein
MKTNIYFDLDGVLRDLCSPITGEEAPHWDYVYKGKSVLQHIEENLDVLASAPVTEYFHYILEKFPTIHILTNQSNHWKPYTWQWLNDKFGYHPFEVTYARPKEKLEILKDGDFLVEDFPLFEDYSKIILIHREYNKDVEAPIRVRNIKELDETFKRLSIDF